MNSYLSSDRLAQQVIYISPSYPKGKVVTYLSQPSNATLGVGESQVGVHHNGVGNMDYSKTSSLDLIPIKSYTSFVLHDRNDWVYMPTVDVSYTMLQ
jgi:hypothetical protein